MKIHHSQAEKEGWISTYNSLPEPNTKVKVCCVHIIDWNMEQIIWESTGSVRPDGIWSITASESATMRKVFDHKLSHWKKL